MTNPRDFNQDVFLSVLQPTHAERRLAIGVAGVCLLVFLAAAPFATTRLPPSPAFIAVYQSLLVIGDAITAVLLFGQFAMLGAPALLVLACGYLFAGLMATVHMLTFPGLFANAGLLGADGQTTAWLYMFWHAGFPIAVTGYALMPGDAADHAQPLARGRIVIGLLAVCTLVVALAALATTGGFFLPPIMAGAGYTPTMILVTTTTWLCSLVALAALVRRRARAVLDLWLMVVMCAWVFDIALSAVLNGGRFDLGFYVGRANGLLASSFVLVMLLVETLRIYARLVGTNVYLRDLANRDGLTGIHNRRALDQRLLGELSRAQRIHQPVSLLMVDVDNFKSFNDTYGHLDGDACLREIASVVARVVRRPGDMAARFGGEEFAVLLPGTDATGAAQMAELLRQAVHDTAIPHGSNAAGVVTVSVGVATRWPNMLSTPEELIAAADRSLYVAKVAGRNQIALAQDMVPTADDDVSTEMARVFGQAHGQDGRTAH